jgi:four helix bundle protein
VDVYAITRKFPDDERFGLTSQMRRAAVSISANIVEASARPSEADYLRLLSIAYASAKELQYEISLSARLGYMSEFDADKAQQIAAATSKALWGLVAAIRAG